MRRSYDDILVRCVKDGYGDSEAMNTAGVNGWVFGNIAFGGLIGIIVDTATANATSYDPMTYVALAVKSEPSAPPEQPTEVPSASAQSVEPAPVPVSAPVPEAAPEVAAIEVAPAAEDTSLDLPAIIPPTE